MAGATIDWDAEAALAGLNLRREAAQTPNNDNLSPPHGRRQAFFAN